MGIIFDTFMLDDKTLFSKDMLNIAVSGLIIVCMFFPDIHTYDITNCRRFCCCCFYVLIKPTISFSLIGPKNILFVFLFSSKIIMN